MKTGPSWEEPVEGGGVPYALPLSLPSIDLLRMTASRRGHVESPVRLWGDRGLRFVSQDEPGHDKPRAVVDIRHPMPAAARARERHDTPRCQEGRLLGRSVISESLKGA